MSQERGYERKLKEWTEEYEKNRDEQIMDEAKGLYQERYKSSFEEDYHCTTQQQVKEPKEPLNGDRTVGKYPSPNLNEEALRPRIDSLKAELFRLIEKKESVVLNKAQQYGIFSRNGGNEMDFTVEVLGPGYYGAEGEYV